MDPHPDGEAARLSPAPGGCSGPHGLEDAQPRVHGPLGIIFMRLGIAKVHQQAISQILGNIAVKALDDLGTGLLVGTDDLAQVFWIELRRRGVSNPPDRKTSP